MTYKKACDLDPRIRTIEKRIRSDRSRNPETDWAMVYKPMLNRCVGFGAEREELQSSLVYELVYDKLRAVLEAEG